MVVGLLRPALLWGYTAFEQNKPNSSNKFYPGSPGTRAASNSWISPSPPSDGGEGWGEEVRFYWFPLSSVLPPRSSRGEDGELDAALATDISLKHFFPIMRT